MPDVSLTAPVDVRLWVALDVHKHSIVAATLPAAGGSPQVQRIENTQRAIARLIDRLGGADGLAVAYEAGRCGYDLLRLLGRVGVACDVIAPSLVPVRAGDRVKTDKRDAKKLVRLYRAGELTFVAPPSPAQEGLRDLVRCADDLRCARTAARHRVAKQLLRHGRIFREGKKSSTKDAHRVGASSAPGRSQRAGCAGAHARPPRWRRQLSVLEHSSSRSPSASRGATRCGGCAASAGSACGRRWGCWPRSATVMR
jgi:transposase